MRTSGENTACAPIGVFDSGYGGLTVLQEIIKRMPGESTIFVGDSMHFPYGPKSLDEVCEYVLGICSYLEGRGCKLIVIACNTATAAGLGAAQRECSVPVIGVVGPGSRAAVQMTRNKRVGVIATQGTIDSKAYFDAIRHLDAGVQVYSVAAPKFVEIAEAGLQFHSPAASSATGPLGADASLIVSDRGVLDCDSGEVYQEIADEYLEPLRKADVDTLVLGCTHFPLIQPLIQDGVGEAVTLVSSAEETARDVEETLRRRGELALREGACNPTREFLTTGQSTTEFEQFGAIVMGSELGRVQHVDLWEESL